MDLSSLLGLSMPFFGQPYFLPSSIRSSTMWYLEASHCWIVGWPKKCLQWLILGPMGLVRTCSILRISHNQTLSCCGHHCIASKILQSATPFRHCDMRWASSLNSHFWRFSPCLMAWSWHTCYMYQQTWGTVGWNVPIFMLYLGQSCYGCAHKNGAWLLGRTLCDWS